MTIARVTAANRPTHPCRAAIVDDLFPHMDSSSAVGPTIRVDDGSLCLAYFLPDCQDSAVVRFTGVTAWYYGGPSDERLNTHGLWGKGLTFYNFHRATSTDVPQTWVATFHDGTFEINATEAAVVSLRVNNASPSAALNAILG